MPETTRTFTELLVAALGGAGVGGLFGWLQRRTSNPAENQTGEAAVITATATAFTEVTSGLREEIERLQRVAVTFEADLASAHDRAVALERQVAQLTADLARVRSERDAALARVELLNGEVRQLQQVMASATRTEGRA